MPKVVSYNKVSRSLKPVIDGLPSKVEKRLHLDYVEPLALGMWRLKGEVDDIPFTAQITETRGKLYIGALNTLGMPSTFLQYLLDKHESKVRKMLDKHSMAKRIASEMYRQSSDALEAARAIFESATPPDSGAWRGRVPELKVSYSSVEAVDAKKKLIAGTNNVYRFEATLRYNSNRSLGGIYTDCLLFRRFMDVYPRGEDALKEAFMEQVKKNLSSLKRDIKEHHKDFPERLPVRSGLVSYSDEREWEDVKLEKVDVGIDPKPNKVTQFAEVSTDFVVVVQFTAKKKEAVTERPFDDMSDKQLNDFIGQVVGPSEFWMDGEYNGSRSQRLRQLREQFRNYNARTQVEMVQQFEERGY